MITKEELYFDSRDNKNKIHAVKWLPEADRPVCILQIIHGMAEYVERYEEFAQNMAARGALVTGEDHLGHGKSVGEEGRYGYFCERDAATVAVRDAHRLKKTVQEQYPGVPYFVLGHSMGSFILRNYLCRYGTGIQGAVVVGTGMNALSFGGYNKRIRKARTPMDWLSRDEKTVDAYLKDPLCGFTFTVNGFQTLLELVARLYQSGNLEKMPKELPVLFVSGAEDPVGDYGKGVERAYQSFLDVGMKNVKKKLYENDRHELLNEVDRKQVYEDIWQWIMSVL